MPFWGFLPEPQDLRARNIGHVIVNTAGDLPWSQYFCCMMYGNTGYVQKYPVADKARDARDPKGCRHLRRRADARPRRTCR